MVSTMHVVTLAHAEDFEGWRDAARALALADVAPEQVRWEIGNGGGDLFAAPLSAPPATAAGFSVPRPFLALARSVVHHGDTERFALLYTMLVRLKDRPSALGEGGDVLVQKLERMAREARRKEMAHLALVPGSEGVESDVKARRAMIGDNLLASWEAVRAEAKGCTRCHLHKLGSQTVFGEGPVTAPIMFVGEQPGDQEDIAGRPFVGPAGQIFDKALEEAGIDRSDTYVTNAVKHFKFERRGRRRIHQKPEGTEIEACRWWIEQERVLIRPTLTVALGATAARSLLGKVVTITSTRGRPQELYDGGECWVTVHPSFLLRIPEADRKRDEYARFVQDLARVKKRLAALTA
jgi:uracil-DNA glycosylase family protein